MRTIEDSEFKIEVDESNPEFVKFIVTGGDASPEIVLRYWSLIKEEMNQKDIKKILVENRLKTIVESLPEVFKLTVTISDWFIGRAVAYVSASVTPMKEFAKDVSHNRGGFARTFGTIKEAEDYLLGQNV